MQKKLLKKDIGEERTFDAESYVPNPTTIDGLLEWLNEMKSQGATHINWMARVDRDGDSSEVEAQAYLEYEESEEECLARETKERENREKVLAAQVRLERMEYERLKQKFDK